MSGCAHNGILNILRAYGNIFQGAPDYVISGFHIMNKNGYTTYDELLIKETAELLNKTDAVYYTCHCTTEYPYQIMKKVMGDKLNWIHSGDIVI